MKNLILILTLVFSIPAFATEMVTTQLKPNEALSWKTSKKGFSSVLVINNPSRANEIKIAILNAPEGIPATLDEKAIPSLNGIFVIPANSPTFTLRSVGDFGGSQINIVNMTNPKNPANATVQTLNTDND